MILFEYIKPQTIIVLGLSATILVLIGLSAYFEIQPVLAARNKALKELLECSKQDANITGLKLAEIKVGDEFQIWTDSRVFYGQKREDGIYLKGHPTWCPEYTKAYIQGSTPDEGGRVHGGIISQGMKLVYNTDDHEGRLFSSYITGLVHSLAIPAESGKDKQLEEGTEERDRT